MSPLEVFTLEGDAHGPTLLILGGVHGNEPCGVEACKRVLANPPQILRGRIAFIPAVNKPALARNLRFLDRNLNRILGEPAADDTEGRIAAELKPHLEAADYLLDLHSYSAGGPPFMFGHDDAATMAFANALPGAAVITGWQENYARSFPDKPAPGIGTTEYARMHGCVAVTFECGQHEDPACVDHGVRAIEAALAHIGLIEMKQRAATSPHIRMRHIFVKEKPGAHARAWKHMDRIAKGEVFAIYDDGSKQIALETGIVILPCPKVDTGIEWGYLGV